MVGSVLLACLGASQQPYAGPVVITGWDHSATWRGESEVRSLERFQVEALALLTADIRKVLGLEPGTPSIPAGPWAPDVLAFAEYVRSGPTRRGIGVIAPASYYSRVDHLNAGEVIRFHGQDWTVLEVLAVEGDTGVMVIARLSGGQTRRALPFPHPAAAALVVIL